MQIYHDSKEREPIGGAGDNSRPKEFEKLAALSQGRYLVSVRESLGLTYEQALDSSVALIETMLQEYAYICNERNKAAQSGTDEGGEDYEWVELPSWDDPTKTIRMKKYSDIGGRIRADVNL